ncbi:YecR family lipoprotein [Desulfovibrio sp.]|uniref:YecR family lipoprotein n=1 Tax=Desulfovibrio sp. TaxID=885 RepID=UPI0023D2F04C|nr:YecR family lipoprotein [Desulfovibrio sp.]MDE7241462.1 YecR-like lipofamily protein [Desulfovibrio sp.]
MKRLAMAFLAAALLCSAGCAKKVAKMWEAAGGRRADATVEVGYTYNPQNELPEANEQQALVEAGKRCQAWGYQEAEPFGLIKSNC